MAKLRIDLWASAEALGDPDPAVHHVLDSMLQDANVVHQWTAGYGWVSTWVPPECAETILQIDAAIKAAFGVNYGATTSDVAELHNLRGKS